jgi:basic membrane protein A
LNKKIFGLVLVCLLAFSMVLTSCAKKPVVVEPPKETKSIKAGFIYVGPVGDWGFSNAHDAGRKFAESKLPWLKTIYVENVTEADCPRVIDRLVTEEKCDIIFTCSFGYMDATIEAGKKYPDKKFMHCSGFKQSENVGTYFTDLYQPYYLCGLMAGALSKTNKIGYVGAFAIPEVIRHINAFALGIKEVNPKVVLSVKWINAWYDTAKAKEAAEALITEGCDSLAFTEDSPTVIEVGKAHTDKGQQIYTFSHYSPMQKFGENSVVSGELCDWGPMYVKTLQDLYDGTWTSKDMTWFMKDGTALLGGSFDAPINPIFVDQLKAVTVDDKVLGKISVYDLVMKRQEQFKADPVGYEPYTGPISDQAGKEMLKPSEAITMKALFEINWFINGIVGQPK